MIPATPSIFAQACDANYQPGVHHAYLAAIVAAKLAKGGARLIVNMPPRHGKSRLFAVETALWQMIQQPGTEAVVASYALDLALRHSREARERVDNEIFRAITPDRIKGDHGGVDYWALSNGSSFKAVGVGGSLTGHGADLLILDDLHKNAAEANSPTMRMRVWEWLQSVAMTRLSPRANLILIGTRWHQDDVTGRLLSQDGNRWELVNLPAIAGDNDELGREPGEALWPERFSLEALAEIRSACSNYFWQALYDGNPVADTGNHVQIDKFRTVERCDVPPGIRCVRFWDLSVTEKTSSDYTAGAYCGRDRNDNLWIIDMTRGQWEWTKARSAICQHAGIDRCQVGVESVGTQKGLVQNLREVFPGDLLLTEATPEKDKLTRALPWFSRVNSGNCYLVRGDWNSAFMSECQAFPLGAHDDQVDAVSGAASILFGSTPGPIVAFQSNRRSSVLASRRERSVAI